MDPCNNPFAPGAGFRPPALAGRQTLLDTARITLARTKKGLMDQSTFLIGLRGVGKTVLLGAIAEEATAQGYEVIYKEAPTNQSLAELLVPALRNALFNLSHGEKVHQIVQTGMDMIAAWISALRIEGKIEGGKIEGGVSVSLDGSRKLSAASLNLDSDLSVMFQAVGRAAQHKGTGVAIFIDETQNLSTSEIGSLLSALQQVGMQSLPLTLFGAGLPQLKPMLIEAKSYAERLVKLPGLGPLSMADAFDALRRPVAELGVEFDEPAMIEVYRQSRGYPYFLQEWGYAAWNHGTRDMIKVADIHAATVDVLRKLDESFFTMRFVRLTPKEQEYVTAMAQLGGPVHRSSDVARFLKVKTTDLAPLRDRLIKKGVIYAVGRGETAFSVPLFDDFVKRSGLKLLHAPDERPFSLETQEVLALKPPAPRE